MPIGQIKIPGKLEKLSPFLEDWNFIEENNNVAHPVYI